MTKLFPVHALLSVYDGHLAGDFSECHRLIEHLTGEPCFTHSLPTIFRTGKLQADLLRQYPKLADVPAPDFENADDTTRLTMLAKWNSDAVAALGAPEVDVQGGGADLGDLDRHAALIGKNVIGVIL